MACVCVSEKARERERRADEPRCDAGASAFDLRYDCMPFAMLPPGMFAGGAAMMSLRYCRVAGTLEADSDVAAESRERNTPNGDSERYCGVGDDREWLRVARASVAVLLSVCRDTMPLLLLFASVTSILVLRYVADDTCLCCRLLRCHARALYARDL